MFKKSFFVTLLFCMASLLFAYETTKPESHTASWLALHGGESKVDLALCYSCHSDGNDCVICHQEIKPRNHNATWNGRVHGIKARWDRSSCMYCHRQDSCVECHATVTPSSHRPGWGGVAESVSSQRHCQNCHYPLQDNTCITCHQTVHTPDKYK